MSFLLPAIAAAKITTPNTCTLTRDLSDINSACTDGAVVSISDYGMCCMVNTIYSITDWIFYILMAFVGIMIIVGAFSIITAGGSPDKVTAGRNYILYAVIGMVVAFFARAIPSMVKVLVGM
jgi:hypothetical protein